MSERTLFPDGEYRFLDHGGETTKGSKAYWPAILYLRMDRRAALRRLAELANALNQPEESNVELVVVGSLERVTDEDEK